MASGVNQQFLSAWGYNKGRLSSSSSRVSLLRKSVGSPKVVPNPWINFWLEAITVGAPVTLTLTDAIGSTASIFSTPVIRGG